MDDQMKQTAQDLGLTDLPEEDQKNIMSGLGEAALKAGVLAITEKLSPEKQEELAKLVESKDAAAVSAFLDREAPGHEATASEAAQGEIEKFMNFNAQP